MSEWENGLGVRKFSANPIIIISDMTLSLSFLTSFYESNMRGLDGVKNTIQMKAIAINWDFKNIRL